MKAAPFAWPAWREGKPEWHIIDLSSYIEEGFNLNTLIYSAIMYKVRAMISAPLRAYKGDVDHPEPLESSHDLAKLLSRPNPHQSFIEFHAQNIVYLNLAGNCYIWFDRPRKGPPRAMYSLNPSRVYVVPDTDKKEGSGIKGFFYVPEGKSRYEGMGLLPQDTMHVKLPNPGDPLEGMGYGLSPISPLAHSADVDNKIAHFLKLFFDKGMMLPGLLKFPMELRETDIARVRKRWKEIYGGYENWADEIGILERGAEYERITPTFEEMGFGAIDERNESRILGPFGVPPILIGSRIGLQRATYSNYQQARRACWEDTLYPESRLFEVEFQYYLRGEEGEFPKFDFSAVPALQKDVPALVKAWVELVSHGVPKDDATQVLGLNIPPLPDGKTVYMPVSLIAVAEKGEEEEATEEGAASAEEEQRKALTAEEFPALPSEIIPFGHVDLEVKKNEVSTKSESTASPK